MKNSMVVVTKEMQRERGGKSPHKGDDEEKQGKEDVAVVIKK